MKNLLLCLLVFCLGFTGFSQNSYEKKTVRILPDSHLKITGDTNISKFKCDFNTARLERTSSVEYKVHENHIKFSNATLKLENEGFDCGNKAINKDFHSLLKTDKYPQISLELTEIHLYKEKSGKAYVTITIAGNKKDYTLPVEISKKASAANYAGTLKLDIRDFDLEPPKKMFGLIVIKDEIEIDFNLAVKFL
ncbi:YceI family protein [Antarcticibacterium sp. 1MA-6-2]|uniref:YceI family protein n=1 Tax=Antarcticibacterium sp. 1MA-6-2 TaxID=2908210 RepID=UPI001F3C9466|nr:YceI family protein [Antarcticibacterium sp. 1MA-6-2]UJH90837.1 YceI family protein [Antarcticibacterium sp. 1MA-6-2]